MNFRNRLWEAKVVASPENWSNSRFECGYRNPNYRAYRRGRENEPGGIGTVTARPPSVGGEILAP